MFRNFWVIGRRHGQIAHTRSDQSNVRDCFGWSYDVNVDVNRVGHDLMKDRFDGTEVLFDMA